MSTPQPDPAAQAELIRRASAGDTGAYEALIYCHAAHLRLYVSARVSGAGLVEEIVQETFVRAYEHLPNYRPERPVIAWLKGIAKNCIREQLRALVRDRRLVGGVEQVQASLAEDQLERLEEPDAALGGHLRRCLQTLSDRARRLVMRRHGEEVPLARLAEEFQKSKAALSSELQRIRKALAQCLRRAEQNR